MIITAIAGMLTGQIHAPSGVIGDIPSIKPTFGLCILNHLKIRTIIYGTIFNRHSYFLIY